MPTPAARRSQSNITYFRVTLPPSPCALQESAPGADTWRSPSSSQSQSCGVLAVVRRDSFRLLPLRTALAFLAALLLASCGGKGAYKAVIDRHGAKTNASTKDVAAARRNADDTQSALRKADGTPVISDVVALAWLRDHCASCHNDPRNQPAISSWSIGRFGLSDKAWLEFQDDALARKRFLAEFEVDPGLPRVYQSLTNKLEKAENASPSPMPLGAGEAPKGTKELMEWLEVRFPFAVHDAKVTYQKGTPTQPPINFVCEGPMRAQTYIRKLVNEAFDREPTPLELALAPTAATLVDDALRDKIRQKFLDGATWGLEFKNVTLKKVARRLGGRAEIEALSAGAFLSAQAKADLGDEFYRLLLMDLDKNYMDVLLGSSYPATKRTRMLYSAPRAPGTVTLNGGGVPSITPPADNAEALKSFEADCPVPIVEDSARAEAWTACKSPTRKTYFASLSFLNSRRSSYLGENNNYGRTAQLITFITGESIRPATEGATQGAPRPTPTCFVSKDFRYIASGDALAARGTLAIPTSARSCQGCHFDRYLAAGSMVFRPYLSDGEQVSKDTIKEFVKNVGNLTAAQRTQLAALPGAARETPVMNALFAASDAASWKNKPMGAKDGVVFTPDFLADLLDLGGAEKACIVTPKGEERKVETLEDLARAYMGDDGVILSRGLAWHIPRILSGSPTTTVELVETFRDTWTKENGKLQPLFVKYLTSKTYSCESAPSGAMK